MKKSFLHEICITGKIEEVKQALDAHPDLVYASDDYVRYHQVNWCWSSSALGCFLDGSYRRDNLLVSRPLGCRASSTRQNGNYQYYTKSKLLVYAIMFTNSDLYRS